MRFLFLCAFIASQFATKVSANTDRGSMPPLATSFYSYLWSTGGNDTKVGELHYNGNAISSISAKLDAIGPLTLYLINKYCRTLTLVSASTVAYDHYIFFPKKVSINGIDIPISIGQKPSDITSFDRGSNYALYKKVADHRVTAQGVGCWDYGYIYDYPAATFDTSLLFDVQHLDAGAYTGAIPMKLGFASYHADSFALGWISLARWSINDIESATTNIGYLPFNIVINNKCEVSPSEIVLSHGGHSITSADGHTVKSNIKIECQLPSEVKAKLTLKPINPPTTSYPDGVGVGLGNGWDSVLTVENTNISSSSTSTDITISKQRDLTIQSVLKKTTSSQPGELNGSAVMEISLQ